jgi:hypothetical protein
MSLSPVKDVIQTKPTIEGAGVRLQRARMLASRAYRVIVAPQSDPVFLVKTPVHESHS